MLTYLVKYDYMKKLPVGIQSFIKLRENDYVYVDKTFFAVDLFNQGGAFFLSRPRRFGKSLFVDTLKCLSEGRKDLFNDLYAYNHWDWQNQYPVIHISFGIGSSSLTDFYEKAIYFLKDNAERLGVKLEEKNIATAFSELIKKTVEKYQQPVVILIDEYDKPILDQIDYPERIGAIREAIKHFYAVLKDDDKNIRLLFMTGVSKFAQISVFSGLNHIRDISLSEKFSSICGYTQEDLETSFGQHLENADSERVKRWYNGYRWLGTSVYNPFDILLFIEDGLKYKSYWFQTGTPDFLVKLLKQKHFYVPSLSNIELHESDLDSFQIENIKLETLLFQTGYLTIVDEQTIGSRIKYKLTYPNLEVQLSFNEAILNGLLENTDNKIRTQGHLYSALDEGDITQLEAEIKMIFAAIPYNNFIKNNIADYEGYYASVLYAYLASLGIELIAEDVSNIGRADLTLIVEKNIYIMEFKVVNKVNESNTALQQIITKQYAQKYQALKKNIYLIGIEFSNKNVVNFASCIVN